VAAEQMLIRALRRARELALGGVRFADIPPALGWFLYRDAEEKTSPDELLNRFSRLDDTDFAAALKVWAEADDFVLALLSQGLLDRRLFRLEWHNTPVSDAYADAIRQNVARLYPDAPVEYLVYEGKESNRAYDDAREAIKAAVSVMSPHEMADVSWLQETLRIHLKRFIQKEIGTKPVIVTTIVEV